VHLVGFILRINLMIVTSNSTNRSAVSLDCFTCGRLRVAGNGVIVTGGGLHLDKEELETQIFIIINHCTSYVYNRRQRLSLLSASRLNPANLIIGKFIIYICNIIS